MFIKIAGLLKLGIGQMQHKNNYILSISQLTKTLCQAAKDLGVDVLHGFSAEKILLDDSGIATAVNRFDEKFKNHGIVATIKIDKEKIPK